MPWLLRAIKRNDKNPLLREFFLGDGSHIPVSSHDTIHYKSTTLVNSTTAVDTGKK